MNGEINLIGVTDELRIKLDEQGLLVPLELLESIGRDLEKWKDEAVSARADHEERWLDDLRQYHGIPLRASGAKGTKTIPETGGDYRETRDNITRPKVLLAASRLGDMLFPTADRNWEISSTPMKEALGKAEAEMTPEEKADIEKRSALMQKQIDDQLSEARYSTHGRAAIEDACLYGSGVLKGPYPQQRRRFKAEMGGEIVEDVRTRASMTAVSIWNFYPQACRNMDECEHVFELHPMGEKQLRKLLRTPGFSRTQVKRLMAMKPETGGVSVSQLGDRVAQGGRAQQSTALDKKYRMWEYTGPMPTEAMRSFLLLAMRDKGVPDEIGEPLLEELDKEESPVVDCVVWMSQGIVCKVALMPYPCDRVPYYVFNYDKDKEDWAGYGIPYIMRDDQKARDQLWQAIMLNSMMSSAPQIGVLKERLERIGPQHGAMDLSCTKPRTWAFNEEVTDIRQALSVFLIPNVSGPLLSVLGQVEANADQHTLMPVIAQGEPTSKVPTASGLAMLLNTSNIVQRRLAKNFDDDVTLPMLTAFYYYNMMNGVEEAKGEYEVIPRGVSHLLVKDVQVTNFMGAMQLYLSNPAMQGYVMPKAGKWARRGLELLDMDADSLLATDEEAAAWAQTQQAPPDPRAEAAIKIAQVREMEVQNRVTNMKRDDDFRAEDRMLDYREHQENLQAKKEIAALTAQTKQAELMIAFAKLDREERLEIARMAQSAQDSAAERSQRQWEAGFDGQLKARESSVREAELNAEVKLERPFRT